MAVGKEIKTKISSVQNTKKITKAMELMAASKMRKARDRMAATKPYAQRMREVVGHISLSHPEYMNAYMRQHEVKRVGYIVISTDRGLCGGLNLNLFRKLLTSLKEWDDQGIEVDICAIGVKAEHFFQYCHANVVATANHLGDQPKIQDLIGSVKVMLDAYAEGKIDRLYLASNDFVNSITQTPEVTQLLPLVPGEDDKLKHFWDYIYEPEAKELLDQLMVRYIESQVYQGVVENNACEQAARMVAMKNATDNATDMIHKLKLKYNKARQAAITQELSEIVSGAAAV
ncbi:F-ATPase gamma subunit [Piscirickettsia salmonis]|uniref:F0F1 ATP synthase subunit gamma n=1 Tax=Piscirickettsia salmonis TaxID=1238 RepID=UPI0007C89BE5|nr:F0F1 ATP synthase subunit gamma [Piscirickettsia salmonis]OAJ35594.1 ATP synthase gamma chain [Piscirickettsiaceae bacterium NZ-RLO1]RNC79238.1 F0F1 ATP synthase subunit gamma [Piscirickettsiaceae bacterium NZ-RLO2]QGP52036.1 F-ATPase gamma subunit [Piscirickettsia salmonis]QGP56625.1 F-ATPase gamma subunit [Piscirickettsia salmonis]QGP61431.1 F-ATPase gamma subunit [Piscirickettsia salmonis]